MRSPGCGRTPTGTDIDGGRSGFDRDTGGDDDSGGDVEFDTSADGGPDVEPDAGVEICANGIDDDGDGLADCDDGDCVFNPACDGGGACPDIDLESAVGLAVATGSTGGASEFSGSCVESRAPEVSFRWVAPNDGVFRFDTLGSEYDTVPLRA